MATRGKGMARQDTAEIKAATPPAEKTMAGLAAVAAATATEGPGTAEGVEEMVGGGPGGGAEGTAQEEKEGKGRKLWRH